MRQNKKHSKEKVKKAEKVRSRKGKPPKLQKDKFE